MIPYIEAALRDLPELNQKDVSAILDGKREAVKTGIASFEIPSADVLLQDKVIEIYGQQTFGDKKYICFAPITRGRPGPKERAVWSLDIELFVQYASN